MTAQGEVYRVCLNQLIKLFDEHYPNGSGPWRVYDHLPGKRARYPFIFLGESFVVDSDSKNSMRGEVEQAVHIYHNEPEGRPDVHDAFNEIITAMSAARRAGPYQIVLTHASIDMGWDNTTDTSLIHGLLTMRFDYYYAGGK